MGEFSILGQKSQTGKYLEKSLGGGIIVNTRQILQELCLLRLAYD